MRCSIHDLVREASSSHADRPALTWKNQAISYRELWTTTQSVAAGLEQQGVGRGERLAIYLDKRPETVVAMLAAARVGAVFVPVNPILKGPQVGHLLRDCDVTTLVTTPPRLAVLSDELGSCPALRTVVLVAEHLPDETYGLDTVLWSGVDAGGEPSRSGRRPARARLQLGWRERGEGARCMHRCPTDERQHGFEALDLVVWD